MPGPGYRSISPRPMDRLSVVSTDMGGVILQPHGIYHQVGTGMHGYRSTFMPWIGGVSCRVDPPFVGYRGLTMFWIGGIGA